MSPKIEIPVGTKFGSLTVIGYDYAGWQCLCVCGNTCSVSGRKLRRGDISSCGCKKKVKPDLAGKKIHKLLVVKDTGNKNTRGSTLWECLCDCGKVVILCSNNLMHKGTKSCGCYLKEFGKKEYGYASSKNVYSTYRSRARDKSLEFNLDFEDFISLTKKNCYYCYKPPQNSKSGRNGQFIYNGLDRLNNNKGYILENVVPCCKGCNRAKNDLSLDEFKELITSVFHYRFND